MFPRAPASLTRCSTRILRQCTHYSSFALASAETIRIPRQNNSAITLESVLSRSSIVAQLTPDSVYHPVAAPPAAHGPSSVLIYLPRGPLWANAQHEASTIGLLRSVLSCTIVRVNFRVERDFRYPSPVHDVLAGYDWIVEHLLPKRSIVRPGRSEHVGRVGVCGELIGGGLATALALTECRVGEVGIVGATVNNAVVDWVSLPTEAPRSSRSDDRRRATEEAAPSTSATDELNRLRGQVFAKPEHYFDPFASPMLFFRTAGQDVPPAPDPLPTEDMDVLSLIEREDFYRQQLTLGLAPAEQSLDPDAASSPDGGTAAPQQKRRASRAFPSPSLGLRLPPFRVSAGIDAGLSEQAAELTHALRLSYARQIRRRAPSDFGRKVFVDDEEGSDESDRQKVAEAESMGALKFHPGLGLWDDTAVGRARVLEAAEWLKGRLGLA